MDHLIIQSQREYWKNYFKANDIIKDPVIEFILFKGNLNIIGCYQKNNHALNVIYEEENQDMYSYDDIEIEGPGFGYESFIIDCLNRGYDIEYISLESHVLIWTYISQYIDELKDWSGVSKYFEYCFGIGITTELIENYCEYELEDLSRFFLF